MTKLETNFFITLTTIFILAISWNISYPSNILIYASMIPLLLFFSSNPFPLSRDTIFIILFAFFIYLLFALVNITMHESFSNLKIQTFNKKFGNAMLLFTFILLFFKHRENILFKGIEVALTIIVGLWIMQFVVYYSTGYYIDLLEPISGRQQHYEAYFIKSQLPIDIIRPTSIYIEPGTYAVNTLPFLILSYLKNNRLTKLHIITLVTYFLSLSLFAIIIATLFLIIVAFRNFKFELNKKNFFFILLFIAILYGIQEYYYFRFIQEENMGAIDIRDNAIAYWQNLSGDSILLGQGNGNTIFYKNSLVDDSSFLFKLTFEFGIFAIPFIIFVFTITWGLPAIFFLIIFLTKLHYLVHVVWFYLAAVHLFKYQIQRKELP